MKTLSKTLIAFVLLLVAIALFAFDSLLGIYLDPSPVDSTIPGNNITELQLYTCSITDCVPVGYAFPYKERLMYTAYHVVQDGHIFIKAAETYKPIKLIQHDAKKDTAIIHTPYSFTNTTEFTDYHTEELFIHNQSYTDYRSCYDDYICFTTTDIGLGDSGSPVRNESGGLVGIIVGVSGDEVLAKILWHSPM